MRYTQPQSGPVQIDQSGWFASDGWALLWSGSNANFNAINGKKTATTGPSASVGSGGIAANFSGANYFSFTGAYAGSGRNITLACIYTPTLSGTYRRIVGTSVAGAGICIEIGPTGQLALTKGGVVYLESNLSLTVGERVFIAISYNHSTGAIKFIKRVIATGQVSTASLTNSAAWAGGDGNFTVGLQGANGAFGQMEFAAIAYAELAFDRLVSLADNPWQLLKSPQRVTRVAAVVSPLTTTGTLNIMTDAVTLSATGTFGTAAALSRTLSSTSIAATAAALIPAALSQGLSPATLTAAGTVAQPPAIPSAINAVLASTLGATSLTAAGSAKLAASLSRTLGSATLSSTTSAPVNAAIAISLTPAMLAATGTIEQPPVIRNQIEAMLSATLAPATLLATGRLSGAGTLAATLDTIMLSASARIYVLDGRPSPPERSFRVPGEARAFGVPADSSRLPVAPEPRTMH